MERFRLALDVGFSVKSVPNMARILIVDDEAGIRETLSALLELDGHQIDTAANGYDAINRFRENPADLVICDIMMPEKGGLETIVELRKGNPGVKIIAISGASAGGQRKILDWATKMGADRTFCKPFVSEDIKTAIKDLLP